MIGSLLPSVFPNASFGIQNSGGGDAPAARDGVSAPLSALRGVEGGDDDAREGGQGLAPGRHDFVHQARHMIGDALKTFAHDLRDSFHQLGFQSDMVMRLAHDVMQAAKQALKSGADFTANLMMAAVSQTTLTSAAGSTSSFEMVASEIEITINHATGSVEINATQVEIQSRMSLGGAGAPQLVDFMDTEAGGADVLPLLAKGDLDAILAAEDGAGESEAMGAVLAGLSEDAPEAIGETDPAGDAEVAVAEEGDGEAAPVGEEGGIVPTPEFAGVSHIIITAFERYLNAENEQITYIKFDAVIPLSAASPEPSVAETVAEEVMQEFTDPAEIADATEISVAERVIEEPVGQPATTDLFA